MRILVDLKTHLEGTPSITQVEKVPPQGVAGRTPINGRYAIPIIRGIDFPVDETSYVLDGAGNVDGGDVSSISYAHLLAIYPQYGNIYLNPLLTADHVDELDLEATFKEVNLPPPYGPSPPEEPVYYPVRMQTGRGPGAGEGQMPTHTAVLAENETMLPPRPGMLITDNIDIGPYTLDEHGVPVGADEFMVYWKLYGFQVSEDVASDYGATRGHNDPAIRYIEEVDQEPTDLHVFISIDDGANWCEVGLLEPIAFCDRSTQFRLAFMNRGSQKLYLATFAAMF